MRKAIIAMIFLLLGCTGVRENVNQSQNQTIQEQINLTLDETVTNSTIPNIVQWCSDSDGNSTSTKGTTTANSRDYEDWCISTSQVKEYYCDGNISKSVIIGCEFGYQCEYGKCEKMEIACNDSDGKNIYKQGTLYIDSLSVSGTFIDKCEEEYWVQEYWCENDNMMQEEIRCPDGMYCLSGYCREDACFDSDNGSIYKKGAANKGTEIKYDVCIDNDYLKEYYCENNIVVNLTVECPDGHKCKNGECEE